VIDLQVLLSYFGACRATVQSHMVEALNSVTRLFVDRDPFLIAGIFGAFKLELYALEHSGVRALD
jgi:hypothetical protein